MTLSLLAASLAACTATRQWPAVKVAQRWRFQSSASGVVKQALDKGKAEESEYIYILYILFFGGEVSLGQGQSRGRQRNLKYIYLNIYIFFWGGEASLGRGQSRGGQQNLNHRVGRCEWLLMHRTLSDLCCWRSEAKLGRGQSRGLTHPQGKRT